MRIALLSDIHGNPIALDAALADIQAQGEVDAYWVLGDLVALGYDPAGVLERLTALPNVRFVRGNTDRYVATGDRPLPTREQALADAALLDRLIDVAHTFAWTLGHVTATGWLSWLADLPLEQRLTLPDGTRLLGVHAAPGTDDGSGVRPTLGDAELAALVASSEADLVCVGHTHWPLDRTAGDVRVVNLGSISNPLAPDLRASYALLEADTSGYHLELRRVEYDRQAVIEALERVRHPGAGFIIPHFLGQRRPPWQ
ncbi:MAG: metallophosphoesterase family protein [Chloroflexota bacterium]